MKSIQEIESAAVGLQRSSMAIGLILKRPDWHKNKEIREALFKRIEQAGAELKRMVEAVHNGT